MNYVVWRWVFQINGKAQAKGGQGQGSEKYFLT